MQTTLADLIRLYDKMIAHLEAKLDAGELTPAHIGELRKLLDSAQVLQIARNGAPQSAPNAVPVDALPFPIGDALDAHADFPEVRVVR